jgi:imidazole glycerol-phosphate synthase subunit HisF
MLRPRITPCLLLHRGGLFKTRKFENPKYVGDPINAVRIFNEKQVDELIILDIDATVSKKGPDFDLVKRIAAECRMPLCYGGGVGSADDAAKLVSLGAEKVSVSSALLDRPELAGEISTRIGRQSLVATIDVRSGRLSGGYSVVSHNARRKHSVELEELCMMLEKFGAGEILVNSVDRDGTRKGYDTKLLKAVRDSVNIPITALGGCGSLADMLALVNQFGVIGAAAGSFFVFKGTYDAVLVNYSKPVFD